MKVFYQPIKIKKDKNQKKMKILILKRKFQSKFIINYNYCNKYFENSIFIIKYKY